MSESLEISVSSCHMAFQEASDEDSKESEKNVIGNNEEIDSRYVVVDVATLLPMVKWKVEKCS